MERVSDAPCILDAITGDEGNRRERIVVGEGRAAQRKRHLTLVWSCPVAGQEQRSLTGKALHRLRQVPAKHWPEGMHRRRRLRTDRHRGAKNHRDRQHGRGPDHRALLAA
jgi:hypothetical protein